jgi:hypothetical protein
MQTTETAKLRIGGHRVDSQGRYTYALVSPEDAKSLGQFKWSIHSHGYAYRQNRRNGKTENVYLHREVMGLSRGQGVVDHINGNPLDCRRENLRVLENNGLNLQNRKSGHGESAYRGVYFNRQNKRWVSQVSTNGKRHYGGSFTRELDAALKSELLRRKLMPFARTDSQLQKDLGDKLEVSLALMEASGK